MAIRNSRPIRWVPTTLCDSADATNGPRGGMQSLSNLISDPRTAGVWMCRPASTQKASLSGISGLGVLSAMLVVGDLVYGLAPSSRNSGKDEPFLYDLNSGLLRTVSGITSANVPVTPPNSGDWTPPIMCQVGGRIIVCHPGFPGGATKFGWFDVSGAKLGGLAYLLNGSNYARGKPSVLGVQPGMSFGSGGLTGTVLGSTTDYFGYDFAGNSHSSTLIDGMSGTDTGRLAIGLNVGGPGIQNGTTIVAVGANSITLSDPTTTTGAAQTFWAFGHPTTLTGDTHTNTTIDNINFAWSLAVGQGISGNGIPPDTLITAVSGTTITISNATVATATGVSLSITGSTVRVSTNSVTTDVESYTITGGTLTAPVWSAGDTDRNTLPSVPVGVTQFNGRAYFACGTDGIVFSDSLLACVVSNTVAVQALTTNDGLAVTAVAPMMLNPETSPGGIVQGIIAFEGAAKMQQITGDPETSDLKMNVLPVATGTLAPLSITPTRLGLAFISPNGLRFIGLDGSVSPVVGDHGQGVSMPFEMAVSPSQICATNNNGVLRISVQTGYLVDSPYREYWYDLEHKNWSGPHTFAYRLLQPWRTVFVGQPVANLLAFGVWQSATDHNNSPTFTENGVAMTWDFETALLPDNGEMAMNAMVEATISVAVPTNAISVQANDENDLGITAAAIAPSTPAESHLQPRPIDWPIPVIFKQMSIELDSTSDIGARIGNLNMRYEILRYQYGPPDYITA